jgi:cellulose synthase operon protein C
VLIDDRQFDAATKQIAETREIRASALQLQFFEGQIALGRKDLSKARDAFQQVLKRAPGHVPAMLMLATIDLQEGQFGRATSQLQSAVTLAPQHTGARALLARSYLSSGQPARALDTLRPVIDSGGQLNAATMMLIGEAHLANGDMKQAAASFEAASQSSAKLGLADSMARIRLSQIAMVSGDQQGAVRELEGIVSGEGAPIQADLALIAGHVREGQTGKALDVAQELVKRRPKDPMAHTTLGSVLLLRNEAERARASFSRALELNPAFMPAVGQLARLDLHENKPADARARFESVLAKEPNNESALVGLAATLASVKAPSSEIAAILQRAVTAHPQSVAVRVALIDLYLRDRDARAALTAAQEAVASAGQEPRILDALGRAQMATGETNQAVDTFNRMAAADPRSTLPMMRLAAVYTARKEPDKAVDALERAQKIAPRDTAIGQDLVRAYLRLGKNAEALKSAKALQASVPDSPIGFVLEGDVYSAGKQWPAAEKAYRDGLRAHPAAGLLTMKLHGVLVASNRKGEADSLVRKWLGEYPTDLAFRNYLGERALRARDWTEAAVQYEAVIEKQPDNALALNNLAWALGQVGDAKALGYAERALELVPDSPAVLDTVGLLTLSKGDAAKSSEYLARAVRLAPDRHDIRLHYAKALLKAGREDEARKELTRLQAVKEEFPGKSEVAGLLK